MRLGICVPVEQSWEAKTAGWDYLEETGRGLLQGDLADADWKGVERVAGSALSVPAINALLPHSVKITGPESSAVALRDYLTRVIGRAASVGVRTLVFGSGAARNVPEGFDRKEARRQILDFLHVAVSICSRHQITLVCEPLNRGECNIINSISEAMEYVWSIDRPHFQCLVDSYHLWLENEPLEHVRDAMPWVRHVHLADVEGRVPPGESGKIDYRPLFAELKRGGYDGDLTVEPIGYPNPLGPSASVLAFLKRQWAEA